MSKQRINILLLSERDVANTVKGDVSYILKMVEDAFKFRSKDEVMLPNKISQIFSEDQKDRKLTESGSLPDTFPVTAEGNHPVEKPSDWYDIPHCSHSYDRCKHEREKHPGSEIDEIGCSENSHIPAAAKDSISRHLESYKREKPSHEAKICNSREMLVTRS